MTSLHDLQHAISGKLRLPAGARDAQTVPLGPIATDSRQVEPGQVFWALPGTHHDGAEYADEAFARGAAGAVVASAGRGAQRSLGRRGSTIASRHSGNGRGGNAGISREPSSPSPAVSAKPPLGK